MLKFGRQSASESAEGGAMAARGGGKAADPTLEVKRRARQRLVGAAILVLTAVIVVPILLDSEPRPVDQDISISIPPRDAPFNPKIDTPPKTVEQALPTASATAPVPAGGGTGSVPDTVGKAPEPAPDKLTDGAATKADEAAPRKPAESASPPATGAAAKGEPAKPADKSTLGLARPQAAKKDDGNKALALLEGKDSSAAKGGAATSDKFAVQVGAFASEEKVKELQAKLRAAGIATYTEKVKTGAGERIRLRAGTFASRTEAEHVLGRIKAAGINGAVIVQ